jgi:hypothetical protein
VTTFPRIVAPVLTLVGALAIGGCGAYEPKPAAAKAEAKPAAPQAQPVALAAKPPESAPQPTSPKKPEERPASLADTHDHDHGDQAKSIGVSPDAPPLAASTLKLEPESLDLGTVGVNTFGTGTVKLLNVGTEAIKLVKCQTSCGCTSTNCPTGETLQPGESRDVEIRITAGAYDRPIKKDVTFHVDGQRPISLPVSLNVIAYVKVEPMTIDPGKVPDGKIVLRAADGTPFHVTGMNPLIIEEFAVEDKLEHELHIDWEKWREMGQQRKLVFNVSHPQVQDLTVSVVSPRPLNPAQSQPRPLSPMEETKSSLIDRGVVQTPMSPPSAAEKLAVSVRYGDPKPCSEALAKNELDQGSKDELLNLAARNGRVEIMLMLLEGGAQPESKDKVGRTPLMAAVQSHSADAVALLVQKGANVNARDSQDGTALLRAAGTYGTAQTVAALIAAGADVNAADRNGQTALMWAARWGDAARVEALVKAGAKVDARDAKGLSALDYAKGRADAEAGKVTAALGG